MQYKQAYSWLKQKHKHQQVISHINQPMTAKQISCRAGTALNSCSYSLWELCMHKLVKCLNPDSRRSRLYWLTNLGKYCQRRLREDNAMLRLKYTFSEVDWDLYGWVCYSHRSTVLKTLNEPMQPATIKRRAVLHNSNLKISANNVRDIIKLFIKYNIVRPVYFRKKAHPRYELTKIGQELRQLLLNANSRI